MASAQALAFAGAGGCGGCGQVLEINGHLDKC